MGVPVTGPPHPFADHCPSAELNLPNERSSRRLASTTPVPPRRGDATAARRPGGWVSITPAPRPKQAPRHSSPRRSRRTSWSASDASRGLSLRPGDAEAGNEPIGALGRRPERAAQPAVTCGSGGPARVWNESAGWRCAPLCGGALIGASRPIGERREDPAGARGVVAAMSPVRALSWAARRSSPVPRRSAI
jgi:hypothetical protein